MSINRMLVMNVIPPSGRLEPNQIHHLETMKKLDIISLLEDMLTYPSRFTLAKVEAIKVEINADIPAKEMITLTEYLTERGIELSKGDYAKVATAVTKLYKDKYYTLPRRVVRPNEQGVWSRKAYAYSPDDLKLIDEALKAVVRTNKKAS
jgi:hypothetical protein